MRMLVVCLALSSSLAAVCGRAASGGALSVGQAFDGTLTAADVDEVHGVIAEPIEVRFEGGGPVAVVVTSDAMDPFAILAVRGAPVGAASGVAGGRGACVVLDAPHPLDVVVYVSSAGAAPGGDFRVSVEPATDRVRAAHDCQAAGPGGSSPGGRTLTV